VNPEILAKAESSDLFISMYARKADNEKKKQLKI
jgi:hypothetical protein